MGLFHIGTGPSGPQDPLEHQEQAQARDTQHTQDQGVDQVHPQPQSDLVQQGQRCQPHRGAHRQPEQPAQLEAQL